MWSIACNVATHIPEFNPTDMKFSEESLVKGIETYDHAVMGGWARQKWGMDFFKMGAQGPTLPMLYGNFEKLEVLRKTFIELWQETDLPSSRDYGSHMFETYNTTTSVPPVYVMLGLNSEAESMLSAVGFTWDKEGFGGMAAHLGICNTAVPNVKVEVHEVFYKLMVFLAASKGSINEEQVNDWIPTPAALAEMERGDPWPQTISWLDVTSFGARAFLKLGRDDDAYELCKVTLSPEQKTKKKTTLVFCSSILGELSAKRGELDQAEAHFADALREATTGLIPMLELLVARDWKQKLLEPNGRDCAAADAAIDAACKKMGKTREQLSPVLG